MDEEISKNLTALYRVQCSAAWATPELNYPSVDQALLADVVEQSQAVGKLFKVADLSRKDF